MSEQEIVDAYQKATVQGGKEDAAAIMRYKETLNAHLQPRFDEVHYQLLKLRRGTLLYKVTLAEFVKRPNAESFLLAKLATESDEEAKADILQLLGHLRSPSSLNLAREFLKHDSIRDREVALFVLGWIGGVDDIPLLRAHMLEEKEPLLRITAASAHRQIAFRKPDLKKQLIESLRIGFQNEVNLDVLPWIIIMIETIVPKKLGLLESKQAPGKWSGDLDKARKKTAAFLESF